MSEHQLLARRLREAYGAAAIPPLRDFLAPDDAAGAYSVQTINTSLWIQQGRRVVGRKIGLTSKAVQAQLKVAQPDFGVLFADMRIEDGDSLLRSKVLQPKAEAEVALVLAHEVDNPAASVQDIIAATAYVLPAIEIVDSRITDWQITFADTVADNGSSAFFVLGNTPRLLGGLDLRTCGMALDVNGMTRSLGAGVACLGHPLNAAVWLARTLANSDERLKSGDIVLTGALGPMVALTPGDIVRAEIGGLGGCGFVYKEDRQ